MVSGLLPSPNFDVPVTEVPAGATAILKCNSNDQFHNFLFWQLGQDKIIGPGNDYDGSKYKYEVLSGKLFIRSVSPAETGYYRCISKHIEEGNLNIGAISMIVNPTNKFERLEQLTESDGLSELDIAKIIFIIISLIILIICGVVLFNIRRAEKARKSRLVMLGEDDDEEGNDDEIYNRTTTPLNSSTRPGPSKPAAEHITGIDNQGLDTDFNSVFEQIAINVSNRNLI